MHLNDWWGNIHNQILANIGSQYPNHSVIINFYKIEFLIQVVCHIMSSYYHINVQPLSLPSRNQLH